VDVRPDMPVTFVPKGDALDSIGFLSRVPHTKVLALLFCCLKLLYYFLHS